MHIVWAAVDQDADEVIAQALRQVLGSGQVRSGRLCPVCASSDHGRPWATHADVPVPVSLSRADPHLVVAVAPGASAVGVDVEESARLERDWPGTVLAPGETAPTAAARLRLWVAKEAVLKADGVGLSVAMDQVRLDDFDGELLELEAPAGFGATLALRR